MTNKVKRFSVRAAVVSLLSPIVGYLLSGTAAQASATSTILFEQPSLGDIVDNLFVPPAEHRPPRVGLFTLILWQPNPNRQDGKLVQQGWQAGHKHGFL